MQNVRVQRDLASLPEPRFIYTAPTWLRVFAAGLLIIGAVMGSGIAVNGFGDGGNLMAALGGVLAAALCLSVLVFGRPTDWRAWINLAATP
jgi:hypothetical protein